MAVSAFFVTFAAKPDNNMKNKIWHTIIILFCVFLCSCNESDIYKQIDYVNCLYERRSLDSAKQYFEQIPMPKKSEKCKAYYNFVKIRLFLNPESKNVSINNIDSCIEFYKENKNYQSLAYSYLYKSYFYSYQELKDSALKYINIVENLLPKTGNDKLTYSTYIFFAVLLSHYHDKTNFVEYSKKALEYAEKLKDNKRIAKATYFLAESYVDENTDSALLYMDRCLSNINKYDDYYQARVYTTMGDIFMTKDAVVAENYYRRALNIKELTTSYAGLLKASLQQNQTDSIDIFFSKSISPNFHEGNIDIMKLYHKKLIENGSYKKACEVSNMLISEIETYYMQKHKLKIPDISTVSNTYDYQVWKIITFCLTILLMVLFFKIRSKIFIDNTNSLKIIDKEINIGEKIYTKIKNSKLKFSELNDYDAKCIITYYETINYNLISKILQFNLSFRQQLFCILQDIKKTKEEIKDFFDFDDNAYFTTKSRIEKKMKAAEGFSESFL